MKQRLKASLRRWISFAVWALIFVLVAVIAYLGVVGMLVWKVNNIPAAENYDAIVVLGAH